MAQNDNSQPDPVCASVANRIASMVSADTGVPISRDDVDRLTKLLETEEEHFSRARGSNFFPIQERTLGGN